MKDIISKLEIFEMCGTPHDKKKKKWKKSAVEEALDQFEEEQLKIAQQTVNMGQAMAMALGGMTPEEAQEIIDTYKKTGKVKQ